MTFLMVVMADKVSGDGGLVSYPRVLETENKRQNTYESVKMEKYILKRILEIKSAEG